MSKHFEYTSAPYTGMVAYAARVISDLYTREYIDSRIIRNEGHLLRVDVVDLRPGRDLLVQAYCITLERELYRVYGVQPR